MLPQQFGEKLISFDLHYHFEVPSEEQIESEIARVENTTTTGDHGGDYRYDASLDQCSLRMSCSPPKGKNYWIKPGTCRFT